MRNRILSLLLVACMLLAAVPALLLPTTAADAAAATLDTPIVTTFAVGNENYPTADDTTGLKERYLYHNNWSVGYKTSANHFAPYIYANTADRNAIVNNSGHMWAKDGTTVGAGGLYATSGNLVSPNGKNGHSNGVQYDVPYANAEINIILNSLRFQTTSPSTSYFVVLVDGEAVWPEKATYDTPTTWYNGATGNITTQTVVATGLSVTFGSKVEFVACSTATEGEKNRTITSPNFTIEFTRADAKITESSMLADMFYSLVYPDATNGQLTYGHGAAIPAGAHGTLKGYQVDNLSSAFKTYITTDESYLALTTQTEKEAAVVAWLQEKLNNMYVSYSASPWQMGVLLTSGANAGRFEPFTRYYPMAGGNTPANYVAGSGGFDNQWFTTEAGFNYGFTDKFVNGTSINVWSTAHGVAGHKMHTGVTGRAVPISSSATAAVAYQYVAEQDGNINVSFNKIDLGTAGLYPYVCVAINGVAVWPASASLTSMSTWFNNTSSTYSTAEEYRTAINTALAELETYVTEGASVQILMGSPGWSNTGYMLDPVVRIEKDLSAKKAYEILIGKANALPTYRLLAYEGAPMSGLIQGTVASINGVATTTLPDYVTEDMTIVMSEITFAGTSAFINYAPNASSPVDEDGNIIYNTSGDHQWTIGRVDTTEGFHAFAEGKTWDTFDKIATSSKTIDDGSLWGASGGGMYYDDQRFAIRNLTDTDAPTIVGAQYTADRDGLVQLGFDTLAVNRDMNPTHDAARYTVTTEDGKKYYAYYLKSDSKVLYFSETVSVSSGVYNYHWNDVTGDKLGTLYTYDAATNTVTALDETTLASMATVTFRAAYSLRKLYERLYIYQNGVQIWPENNGTFTYVADPATFASYANSSGADSGMKAAVGTLPTIIVNKGDTITFGLVGEDSMSNQVFMKPTVKYVAEAPTVTAQVVLKEKFNIDMEIYASPLAEESGVYINGVKNDYAALRDLAAKEICEEFTYATYQVINGVEIKSSTKTYTGKQVLAQHQASTNDSVVALANATIHYAEAAASYFKGDALSAEASAAIAALAAPQEASASITDTIEEQVTFQGANLLLKDTIQLKITFKKVAGAGDITPSLQVVSSGMTVKGMFDVTLVGDTYEAVIEIPMSAYNETLAISVWSNTEQISETLTYGVGVYAYRVYQANAGNTALQNVLKTIIALGDKAIAYQP